MLVVVLAGGFTTNFIWCVILNLRNHTGYQYFQSEIRGEIPKRNEEHILEAVTDAPAEEMAVAVAVEKETRLRAPMLPNYLFSALAGTTWYMQFFFYTMGETQMGRFKFSSWTLHMASIIIFSTLWGIASQRMEWSREQDEAACGFEPVGVGDIHSGGGLRELRRWGTLKFLQRMLDESRPKSELFRLRRNYIRPSVIACEFSRMHSF